MIIPCTNCHDESIDSEDQRYGKAELVNDSPAGASLDAIVKIRHLKAVVKIDIAVIHVVLIILVIVVITCVKGPPQESEIIVTIPVTLWK